MDKIIEAEKRILEDRLKMKASIEETNYLAKKIMNLLKLKRINEKKSNSKIEENNNGI